MTDYKALILYVHQDGEQDNRERVLGLAKDLIAHGVDVDLDQFHEHKPPPEGWPLWMKNAIEAHENVLVVVDKTLKRRWEGHEETGKGLGAAWEGSLVTNAIYRENMRNGKFIPVGFVPYGQHRDGLPAVLASTTYYDVTSATAFEMLLRRFSNQPAVERPPLGVMPIFENASADTNIRERQPPPNTSPILMIGNLFTKDFSFTRSNDGPIRIEINSADPDEQTYLSKFRKNIGKSIPVAKGRWGAMCELMSCTVLEGGFGSSVTIELREHQTGGIMSEFSTSEGGRTYTADEMAQLRAEFILLGKEPPVPKDDFSLVHHFIKNNGSHIDVDEPVLPRCVTKKLKDFATVDIAKLVAVYYLCASGTVDHIERFDLIDRGNNRFDVSFEGLRPQLYTNTEPFRIQVKGSFESTNS